MEIETKVLIRLSKRFLIVAALLVLVTGSSAAVVPTRAQGDSKIVYVAICVDSEMWGGIGQYIGSADPHPSLNVKEYSRTVPMTVAAVFASDFRNSNRDSFGNIFKLSWFAEMDYLISQSNFVWADGSPAGVSGYTAIRDLLVNNWGTEIQTYGDSVEYHHHFIIYDGTWKRYDSGPDAGYPGYHMYALDQMIIDRNFYPSSWRSGWWIMPPALSSWLEQWMPFDYTPTTGIWYPVHPGGMSRWQTKCPYAPNVPTSVNSAFAYASEHGSAVFSLCTHDQENLKSQVGWLQWCLNTADANEAAYPNVSFKYVSAREAMQRALGFTDFTPPTFTVTSSDNTYTIVSSEPLWKNHPYIALKYTNGTYGHMSATPTGTNTWTVTPPASASAIGVAGSDLYGNPGTATFTQDQYSLTVDTVGSGSVTKSPDQATYASGTVVTLTAVPSAGWSFSAWSGDLSGSTNPASITMDGDKSVTATFTQDLYTLTVTTVGGGSVVKNPDQAAYVYGDTVILTANPALGWSFSSWSGDLGGNTNPATIIMDGNKIVTATFTENQYTLTINTVGSGSVSKIPDQATYVYGTSVELTATSNLGWSFGQWTGDLTGSVNPATITITGNIVITATFTEDQYTLSITITGDGTVTKSPNLPTYSYGSVVTLTATPNIGWSFDGWSGDLIGSENPTTITMTSDKSVTALFTQNQYTLTINIAGQGSVSKEPDQAAYTYSTSVQLTATAEVGWTFAGWSGDLSGSQSPADLAMDDNKIVTATFIQNEYTLDVSIVGSGSVTKAPDQSTYHYNDVVELTAVPSAGWSLSGWSGGLVGNPTSVTITGDLTVTATFTQIEYSLTVNISPVDGGSVSRNPDSPHYHNNDVVQLTATPALGYSFAGWSDGLTGNPTSITITDNTVVTATFTQLQYTLTINVVGSGSVTQSPDPPYTYGTEVTLTAVPATGWSFSGWSGDLSGSANPETITITGNKAVTATFAQIEYTLDITIVGSGSVIKSPNQATYHLNDAVELTATADPGWSFSGWSGDLSGSTNPAGIAIDGNKAVTATFTQDQYTLTLNVEGSGSVSKAPDQATYIYGTTVELTAVPALGWSFTGWSGDLSGSENPTTIVMDGNKVVTATFTQDRYTLSVTVEGSGTVTKNPDMATYTYGAEVQLTATAEVGWYFSGWSGALVGNPTSVTITGDTVVTAYYTQIEYTLTVSASPVEGGSVSKSPESPHYHYNDVVELTATTSAGWSFSGWSGGLTGNPTSVTITGDMTITATFSQIEYSLTINIVGSGSVSKNPDQAAYTFGTSVQLAAIPTLGWSFSGWSGDLFGSANPETIIMTGNKAITATFTQNVYTLTVVIAGSGSVNRNNTGPYHYGDVVGLTAVPATGWSFQSWSGDLSGSVNPSDLTITGDMSVTATFTQDVYSITASVIGVGGTIDPSGVVLVVAGGSQSFTIEADPGYVIADAVVDGVSQGAIPEYTFNAVAMDHSIVASFRLGTYIITASVDGVGGTIDPSGAVSVNGGETITFTITPENGYHILNVMVDGTYMGPQNSFTFYEVDRDHTITAIFARNEYSLTIIIVGPGSVTTNPNKISYSYGDIVELTAIPNNKNFEFAFWGGDLTGNTNPATIIMDGSKTVTATFTKKARLPASSQIAISLGSVPPQEYSLTVSTVGSGSVVKVPDQASYHLGDVVTLTAIPTAGWSFSAWSGDISSSLNPVSVTISGTTSVTATFTQNAYKLTFTAGVAQSVTAGALSSVISVQRQDKYGNPVTSGSTTVSLKSTSRKDVFYSDAGITEVTSVVIKDGSSTVDFWYIAAS